jgi:hypothetical protein
MANHPTVGQAPQAQEEVYLDGRDIPLSAKFCTLDQPSVITRKSLTERFGSEELKRRIVPYPGQNGIMTAAGYLFEDLKCICLSITKRNTPGGMASTPVRLSLIVIENVDSLFIDGQRFDLALCKDYFDGVRQVEIQRQTMPNTQADETSSNALALRANHSASNVLANQPGNVNNNPLPDAVIAASGAAQGWVDPEYLAYMRSTPGAVILDTGFVSPTQVVPMPGHPLFLSDMGSTAAANNFFPQATARELPMNGHQGAQQWDAYGNGTYPLTIRNVCTARLTFAGPGNNAFDSLVFSTAESHASASVDDYGSSGCVSLPKSIPNEPLDVQCTDSPDSLPAAQ